jgi:hypothetical protein
MAAQRGSGVSSEGYDGAHTLFDKVNAIAKEMHLVPTVGREAAEAASKSAVEAFQAARDGIVNPHDAFFGKEAAAVPKEFPKVEFTGINDAKPAGADGALGHVGKAINELMSNMGDMVSQIVQGPMGMLGSVLGFLTKLFTEVATNIGEAIGDTAQELASSVEEVMKKHLKCDSGLIKSTIH